jgi:hypothetical protein
MEKRLTEEQMAKVVAEVTRLAQDREETLDREQVNEILRDLNLPTDLVDDALAQLNRREALERERRRNFRLTLAAVVLLIAGLVLGTLSFRRRDRALDGIAASSSRLTPAADNGGSLESVARSGDEVFYRVVLSNVPPGEELEMGCRWIDPQGRVFRQNRWQTRATDKAVWATACRCQFGAAAQPGTWKVEMALGERVLSTSTFRVE